MNYRNLASEEDTERLLHEVLRKTRQEPGMAIETIANIISMNFDQAETRALIERLVDLQGKRYGERLYK